MTKTRTLPEEVLKMKEELTALRRSKNYKRKLPEYIWDRAAALCESNSPSMVAKWLSLDYTKLKTKIDSQCKTDVTEFIEIISPGQVLEIEGSGIRMKISGVNNSQIISIARALL